MSSWREEEDDDLLGKRSSRNKSKGVQAKSFYHSKNRISTPIKSKINKIESSLNSILERAFERAIQEQRNEWKKELELKLAVYKEISFLKMYPLQEMAFQQLESLQKDPSNPNNRCEQKLPNKMNPSLSPSASSYDTESTADTSSSLLEKTNDTNNKKRKDNLGLASTERERFLADFEKDQSISIENSNQDSALPALWSTEPRVFAIEKSSTGKRKYVVASFGRFADKFWKSPNPRHYYELIKHKDPCRLYFDIEFCKKSNSHLVSTIGTDKKNNLVSQEDNFMHELYLELAVELQEKYPNIKPIKRSDIVDLDSSTDVKFSRHWIVHMYTNTGTKSKEEKKELETLFSDNIEAGKFVNNFISRLSEDRALGKFKKNERPYLHKFLFVNTKRKGSQEDNIINNTTCIVDLGVYTRNRLFRLIGASKYGKPPASALRIAKFNTFKFPQGFSNQNFYLPEMIMNVKEVNDKSTHEQENKLSLEESLAKFRSKIDWSVHAEVLASTLVVPLNATRIAFPILPRIINETEQDSSIEPYTSKMSFSNNNIRRSPTAHQSKGDNSYSISSTKSSPFPTLADYITKTFGSRGGRVQGFIRSWNCDISFDKGARGVIMYQMSRNRYCENIKREHKSNNVMWTVDVSCFQCWQSCHDPDCRLQKFRGKTHDLPKEVIDDMKAVLFDLELAHNGKNERKEASKNKKEIATSYFPENDEDAEFEKALLALNIEEYTPKDVKCIECKESEQNDDLNANGPVLYANVDKKESSTREETTTTLNFFPETDEDAEFEKALMALNIDQEGDTIQKESQADFNRTEDCPKNELDDSWDNAFLEAIASNPEKFPE